jgi:DNA modification methylase
MGRSDYQRQYEPILYGWAEGGKHHWCGDRDQSDVWQIKKPHKNDLHPTMKPVELVERAIRNSSKPGDTVMDQHLARRSQGRRSPPLRPCSSTCIGLENRNVVRGGPLPVVRI